MYEYISVSNIICICIYIGVDIYIVIIIFFFNKISKIKGLYRVFRFVVVI